ncbi:hypothetical protein [Shinella zoogloeoides]|uniref:hypothetical protein n=1 Tax=Shinella zoogloeoides TaxID=352475 RepID=UPI00299D94AF|nr:hypothetical protein [Shinella zoogloeoides]
MPVVSGPQDEAAPSTAAAAAKAEVRSSAKHGDIHGMYLLLTMDLQYPARNELCQNALAGQRHLKKSILSSVDNESPEPPYDAETGSYIANAPMGED